MVRSGTLLFVAAVSSTPVPAAAQEEVVAFLEGTVQRGGEGIADVPVTLHRVGSDTAGVLSEVASGDSGGFRFRLPRLPNPAARDEVYFASVEYQGIMYFGAPIATPADLDSLYVIAVHDTAVTSSGIAPVAVQTRTVVLERMERGWAVTDLFEIRNDGSRTFVGLDENPVWSHSLPLGATGFELGESDLAPDAVQFVEGAVQTSAPIPPGLRLYLFRYRITTTEFGVPQSGSERFELLIREPAPGVSVTGLRAEAPITPDASTTYRRFAGVDLAPSEILVAEADESSGVPLPWLAATMGLALAFLALWGFRRGSVSPEDRRARIVLEIARLDEDFQSLGSPGQDEQHRYRNRRQALAEKLRRLS